MEKTDKMDEWPIKTNPREKDLLRYMAEQGVIIFHNWKIGAKVKWKFFNYD